MKTVSIGTSGYNYKDWKGEFYPEGLPQKKWLSFYSEYFKTVEINATFYGSFKILTYENWASQVPEDFSFTIKRSRFITHIKRLKESEEPLQRLFESAEGLGAKLTCVLWQMPGNFHNTDATRHDLEAFLTQLPQHTRHAVEFRHDSWLVDDVFDLLDTHQVGFVINDSSRYPWTEKITGDFVYIRFHGPRELYSSTYSEEEMRSWAEKIKRYRKSYDVYCYFNNDYYGYAIHNARQLLQFLT